jgi:outer membrane protein assembly factor BamB
MNSKSKFAGVLILYFTIIHIHNVYAQDWPQYLGPDRNSTSDQKGILRTWPETGPEVLWTIGIGIGYGGPVVQDGKVYFLDRDDEIGDKMRCFDLLSGEELWEFEYDAPGSVMFPGSRSVPIVNDNYVYSCGPYGDLYCIDINSQQPVWKRNIWTDFGGDEIPRWAITQCPLIYEDLLIAASQAPDAGVVAYDKLTGEVIWKTPSLGPVGYVSPSLAKIAGEDHVVMITAARGGRGEPITGGRVVGIDPLKGEILWDYKNWQCRIPAPSAFDAGDGKVLIIGGYQAGAAMIEVKKESEGNYAVSELFKTIEFGAHTKPPLFYDGYFYAHYRTNERRDGMVCMSLDGEIMWKTKNNPDFNKGSMILADRLILSTDGGKSLYLIEPDPEEFKPLASSDLLEAELDPDNPRASRHGTQNWAPIALADGKLLIRDKDRLMCVKVAE